jgi:biopolymer transport protein ExbD
VGGGSAPGGGGKSANFELNLVPFIDLFSTLICFLLITAAWNNLEAVNAGAPPKSVDQRDQNDVPPEPPPDKPKVTLSVTLHPDRLEVAEDKETRPLPHRAGNPDYAGLTETLRNWRAKYPNRQDVVLASDNRAPYKHLVKLMDVFIDEKFPEVSITLN